MNGKNHLLDYLHSLHSRVAIQKPYLRMVINRRDSVGHSSIKIGRWMNENKYSGPMSQNLKFSEISKEFMLEDLPKKKC